MKSILMSIQPKWVAKILNGEKTIDVRKTAPKEVPLKVYIYCTKGRSNSRLYKESSTDGYFLDREGWRGGDYEKRYLCGKVVGEFVCDKVDKVINHGSGFSIFNESEAYTNCVAKQSGLYFVDLKKYLETKDGYAWHISALKVYDKPRELGEFYSIKQCKPEYSPFGYQWTWEDRHKRNTGGWGNKYRPVPIECHRCRCLVSGEDYLDEKSGCVLFDYECISKYHKPIERPPQSWQYVEEIVE